jgi:hypothetical protein
MTTKARGPIHNVDKRTSVVWRMAWECFGSFGTGHDSGYSALVFSSLVIVDMCMALCPEFSSAHRCQHIGAQIAKLILLPAQTVSQLCRNSLQLCCAVLCCAASRSQVESPDKFIEEFTQKLLRNGNWPNKQDSREACCLLG